MKLPRNCLLVLVLLFSACKKDNESTNMVIEGIVMDTITNILQDSVKVELFTQNRNHVVYTDKNGYYNLGSFPIGDYLVEYSKKGYVNTSEPLRSFNNLSAGNIGGTLVASLITYLIPANEDAVFTVYRQYLDGEVLAAADFPYTIIPGGYNSVVKGKTNSNGIISLQNLPQRFGFYVDYNYNGIRYKTSVAMDTHRDNYVVVYGFNPQANLGIVTANILDANGRPVGDFAVNSHITVQFTLPVDTAGAAFNLLEDGWSKIPIAHSWSNGQMKLEIIPKSLLSKTYYSLSFDVTNEDKAQSLSKVLSFTTK